MPDLVRPGTRVGPYEVLERIGRGAMSEVVRARHLTSGRDVAIKVLDGPADEARRDAEAVATLHHPNIVSTYDVIDHEGHVCIVQEWIAGGSLDRVLRTSRTLDLPETLRLAAQLTSALAYTHDRGILHRDIKPTNVLRTDGRYKLTDFGALGRLEAGSHRTHAGQIAGTPMYMAPEQFAGAPQSAATDVYGLGLLLLVCLHGEAALAGGTSFVDLYRSRTGGGIVVPPSPIQDALRRCLAADSTQRPQSAAEMQRLLDAVDRQHAPSTTLGGPGVVVPAPAPQPPPSITWDDPRVAAPAPTSARGGPPLALLAAASVLAAGAVVLVATGSAAALGPMIGVAIAAVALTTARSLRARWTSQEPEAERKAAAIVLGAQERGQLTASLAIEVDQVVRRLESLDAGFLGMTIVAMLREFEQADASSDRQAALLNVVSIMEKVQARLSPWHVRHKDAIASSVAVLGCLAGVGSAIGGFVT